MKIFVTGTRGIPDIPGGVEKHCQELYPLIVKAGAKVWLSTRSSYAEETAPSWKGIHLIRIYAPGPKSLEAIVHTFLSLIKARQMKADIVHIHAVGPALLVPFARLLGFKVVMTHHGPDYHRLKWGPAAKFMLRLGEYLGGKFSNEVIAISEPIRELVRFRCGRHSHLIYNGVPMPVPSPETGYINRLGLVPSGYLLAVSRFVPEKGLDLLITAFEKGDWDLKLVLAGDADHETDYSRNLKKRIDGNPNILRPGYVTGSNLSQLFSHARLFVLPSYHEGLPIALLEAMSFGLDLLVSDIPANKEVPIPRNCYFKCGDAEDLQSKIEALLSTPLLPKEKKRFRQMIESDYNWPSIARKTMQIYQRAERK